MKQAKAIRGAEELEAREAQLEILKRLPVAHTLLRMPRSRASLPFPVDPSHVVVLRGGYVGCMCCGHVTGYQVTAWLSRPCRLRMPRGGGTRGAIVRLINGQLPHRHDSRPGVADEWPTGEIDPPLHLVGRGHLTETDLTELET